MTNDTHKTKTILVGQTPIKFLRKHIGGNHLNAKSREQIEAAHEALDEIEAMLEAAPPVEDAMLKMDNGSTIDFTGNNEPLRGFDEPNKKTIEAIEELENGGGEVFKNEDELFNSWDSTQPDNAEALEKLLKVFDEHCETYDIEKLSEESYGEDAIEEARATLTNQSTQGWRDISTAPKDGEHILAVYDDCVGEVKYHEEEGQWREVNNHPTDHWGYQIYPTLWQPIPQPPEQKGE